MSCTAVFAAGLVSLVAVPSKSAGPIAFAVRVNVHVMLSEAASAAIGGCGVHTRLLTLTSPDAMTGTHVAFAETPGPALVQVKVACVLSPTTMVDGTFENATVMLLSLVTSREASPRL